MLCVCVCVCVRGIGRGCHAQRVDSVCSKQGSGRRAAGHYVLWGTALWFESVCIPKEDWYHMRQVWLLVISAECVQDGAAYASRAAAV